MATFILRWTELGRLIAEHPKTYDVIRQKLQPDGSLTDLWGQDLWRDLWRHRWPKSMSRVATKEDVETWIELEGVFHDRDSRIKGIRDEYEPTIRVLEKKLRGI